MTPSSRLPCGTRPHGCGEQTVSGEAGSLPSVADPTAAVSGLVRRAVAHGGDAIPRVSSVTACGGSSLAAAVDTVVVSACAALEPAELADLAERLIDTHVV